MTSETTNKEEIKAIQTKVKKRTATSVILSLTIAYVTFYYIPIPMPSMPTAADRAVFTLKWQFPCVFTLFYFINLVMSVRFSGHAHNPFDGRDSQKLEIPIRCLNNTVEQLILHVITQLMISTFLSEDQMKVIPIMSVLFVFGRVLFYIGYKDSTDGHTKRSLGMVMNFFTTAVGLLYVGYSFVSQMILGY